MKTSLLFILSLFFAVSVIFAQNTVLKTPPGFQYENSLVQQSQVYNAELKQDVVQLRTEDIEYIKDGHPLRIAVGIAADLDLNNEQRLTLPTGERILQKAIKSENANGLILSFKELYIPEGGELFVYTEDRTQSVVFSHETNPAGGAYATSILYQDEVVLEYVESTISSEQVRINVSNIGYVYRTRSALADVMTCYINVSCAEGDNWQLQKKGVVGMEVSFKNGNSRDWYICSGSLINNVREDQTPYILTANHCIEGYDTETFSTMTFNFFKESTNSGCTDQSTTSSLTKNLTGASLIADVPISQASDGTLLKLTGTIPEDWEVYYNGWDASGVAATSGVSIHHPNGMVKKISTFNQTLESVGKINFDGATTGANAHWRVNWTRTANGQSVTYGGSSGSPLFNENGHIVGTLTGGASLCQDPDEADYYGKFSYHWDQYSDETQHFKNFLDPDNVGTLVLDGYDPHAPEFENEPVATAATEITKEGFTANWNAVENAIKYFLDIYRIEGNNVVYLDGYKSRNVGNVTSYSVSGFSPETEYYYVVRAGTSSTRPSEASNEISVTTLEATLDFYTPVATDATTIFRNSFQANWEPLKNATSYILNVYKKEGGDEDVDIVDFTGEDVPTNWTTNSTEYYENNNYSGEAVPAIKFADDNVGKYIQSPDYGKSIKSIEFWYRGAGADTQNYLTVSVYTGLAWKDIKKIQPLNNTQGSVISISESDLLEDAVAAKISYTKTGNGNVAVDDIKITYGDILIVDPVSGYEDKNVGNTSFYVVDGLEQNTQYYYTVIASDETYTSNVSNEIGVITNDEVANNIIENPANPIIWTDGESIIIHSDSAANISIYNVTGQLLFSQVTSQGEFKLSKTKFSSGIYFVKLDNNTHKILIK